MNLNNSLTERNFEYIYVEKDVINSDITANILEHFANSKIVVIDHYKDVFNRKQKISDTFNKPRKLIIASKKGQKVYKGAPVCQDFGNAHFFYTSCIMNCIYNCEYCYLKGMYPSKDIVIFVNIEDIFEEVKKLLREYPVYLCVSYDTDLMALEDITGFIAKWNDFVIDNPNLLIEIRTKSANTKIFKDLNLSKRLIFAYTISPDEIIDRFEHFSARLDDRINAINTAISHNLEVRLCFDPILYDKDFEKIYSRMLDKIICKIDLKKIKDVSVGSFRISDSYLKNIRNAEKNSSIVQYPFDLDKGYYHYPYKLAEKMENFITDRLLFERSDLPIFRWEDRL